MTSNELELSVAAPAGSPSRERGALVRVWLLWGALACYFAALLYFNCYWVCYPTDNDLDEVAWLSSNLDLGRPESLANQGYPPGLPLLLRGLTPLVGSFLRATFLWQSIVCTASVFFVYRICSALSRRPGAGVLGALCAALGLATLATSEFADGTSTALLLAGLWALTRGKADRRGFFQFGLAAGLAYLFRTHYLMLIVLVPASLLLVGFGWRVGGRLALGFLAGFAATAWPLWLLNTLAYGTPLHAGVSQYNIAFSVISNALSWEDYVRTYNRWPLARILRERPMDLVDSMVNQSIRTFGHKLVVAGAAFGLVAITLVGERQRRQLIALVGLLAVFYVSLVIVPTRFTDRSFAPVGMLAAVLFGCGMAELVNSSPAPRRFFAGGVLLALAVSWPAGLWKDLSGRHDARLRNIRIVDILVANGMKSSEEVFSNIWSIYNLADPLFVTFYNYGGWILLDSKYAAERPAPRAKTRAEWQAFLAEQGIKFVVLRNRKDASVLFRAPPPEWKQLFSDGQATVWAL
jgi:Dolichyl-phosphate-mannose-protein mannosyltransferase